MLDVRGEISFTPRGSAPDWLFVYYYGTLQLKLVFVPTIRFVNPIFVDFSFFSNNDLIYHVNVIFYSKSPPLSRDLIIEKKGYLPLHSRILIHSNIYFTKSFWIRLGFVNWKVGRLGMFSLFSYSYEIRDVFISLSYSIKYPWLDFAEDGRK